MSGVNGGTTGMNHALACAIYDELNKKGAGLGNASVVIIESVLDREGVKDLPTEFNFEQYARENKPNTQNLTGMEIYLLAFRNCFKWLDKL